MNRIKALFKEKQQDILSVYVTAGFPNLDSTMAILEALQNSGVDMVELGIPYSDPIADGPTIQESSAIALKNGMKIRLLFEQLSNLREKVHIPIVMMSYFNPINVFGFEDFCQKAVEVGVDGLIIPDLPAYEYENLGYKQIVEKHGLSFCMLITADTSESRIQKIDELSNGFIYMVSSAAITGGTGSMSEEQKGYFKRVAAMGLNNPLVIGFGIHDHQTFLEATRYCSGAIVGSAFIRAIKNAQNLPNVINEFVKRIKGAV